MASTQSSDSVTERNKAIVQHAFEEWAAGGQHFFDILDQNVEWTIVGSGPSAQRFQSREAFLDGAYHPIANRFAHGMIPKVLGLYADGDHVIIRWDGVAEMAGGQLYRNSYAWFFQMREGKVVKGTAFLDLPTYDAAVEGRPLPLWPSA